MGIFRQLEKNKGTTSSALGKELAKEVLKGKRDILSEAIELTLYEKGEIKAKNVRAGAAKIVEQVAEKQPELVAPFLENLLPALDLPEPQTKWMIIRTMGYCAHINREAAVKAVEYAKRYLENKEGLCLSGATELYLGDIGALSKEDAENVFQLLEKASKNAEVNEVDWILEAYLKIYNNLGEKDKEKIIIYANENIYAPKKSTQNRVKKILKLVAT
jgi:hypothetical protein